MKYDLVYEALTQANREDLIGFGPKCLIKSRGKKNNEHSSNSRIKTKDSGKNIKVKSSNNPIDRTNKKKNKPVGASTKSNFGSRQDNKNKAKNKKRK
jgi:hypothetical protein